MGSSASTVQPGPRRRWTSAFARRSLRLIALGALAAALIGQAGSSYAQTTASPGAACEAYTRFTALGGASGARTFQSWPGVNPAESLAIADGFVTGAQAQVGSGGSSGWAGAAYSSLLGAT